MICICLCLLLGAEVSAVPAQAGRGAAGQPPPAAPQGGLDARLGELSQQIAREMSDNQKRTVAVVEFVDLKGRVTDFGRFLAEELITRLYQTRKFKVIERQLLNKIVTEQKLSLTGIVDQASAQKLGRLLGVDAIASGTVTDLGRSLKVNARLIDTTTAEVFAVASGEIVKDDAVAKLMGGEDSSPTPSNKAADSPAQGAQPKRALQKIDSDFFTFELQQCRMSGTTVACDFVVTNNGDDRRIGLGNVTKLFDDLGNEYSANQVSIASKQGYDAYADLVSGIAVKVRFTFEGVSAQASRISLLDVYVALVGRGFHIQFRNISLRGQTSDLPDRDETTGEVTASARSGEEWTVNVYGNRDWTDTGIDVSPGMQLEVEASGRVVTGQNKAANDILGNVFKGGNAPPSRRVPSGRARCSPRFATRPGASRTPSTSAPGTRSRWSRASTAGCCSGLTTRTSGTTAATSR
jgi:TolB-like protein